MNSKQRRQDRRAWKYVIVIDDKILWDDYHTMWDWTAKTFGTTLTKWRERHNCIGTHWEFKREREALIFRLKWGGNYELRNNQIRQQT